VVRSRLRSTNLRFYAELRGGGGLRVHVGDSEDVSLLLEYFEEQADCIAVQVGETEIEVSLIGSYRNEAHDAAVEQLVRAFRRRHAESGGFEAANGQHPAEP
jgi:hypothetical protein